jgi:hypothetical protein
MTFGLPVTLGGGLCVASHVHHDDTSEPFDPATVNELNELANDLQRTYLDEYRWQPRLRRAITALARLGMPVPSDWITLDHEGEATFAPLPASAFDRLVCLLEDLADDRPITITVARTGPTLFDPGAPQGPIATSTPSTVHPVIPS